jgi:hypothetical protein
MDFWKEDNKRFNEMITEIFPKWDHLSIDLEEYLPETLVGEIMDKIRETNTVGTLTPPVDVWIDKEGYYTIDVYDEERDNNPTKDREDIIVEAMARAMFVSSWADYEEEHGRYYPGQELMDIAPDTPQDAIDEAVKLYDEIEEINDIDFNDFIPPGFSDDWDRELADEFGHYLAMEALGHGVSWMDDYEHHGLKIPNIEYYYYPDEPEQPEDDDYIMYDTGHLGGRTGVSVGGREVGTFSDQENAEEWILRQMDKDQFWPNVWYQDDHGGIELVTLDSE